MTVRAPRVWFYALFTLSGVAGLILRSEHRRQALAARDYVTGGGPGRLAMVPGGAS